MGLRVGQRVRRLGETGEHRARKSLFEHGDSPCKSDALIVHDDDLGRPATLNGAYQRGGVDPQAFCYARHDFQVGHAVARLPARDGGAIDEQLGGKLLL